MTVAPDGKCWTVSVVGPAHAHLLHRGSGKAGRHVAKHLAEQGHQVTNADLVPLGHPAVADLRIDLTDLGETYSALAGLARMTELEVARKRAYDAVVHFAAVPAILLTSDSSTYGTNVLSTYNVLGDTAGRPRDRVRILGDDLRDLLRPGRAATAVRAGGRGPPDGPRGLLCDVQGDQ